ncbi:MAG: nuclear transport factor 2 family protein [Pseudolabrys sp.]|nr:nuclear transport factor 2 family protein [Pseudolabrys sp.]
MQFDPLTVVIDWLDACRNKDIKQLMSLYAHSATLHCDCTARNYEGRQEIETYWQPRLAAAVPSAFQIDALDDDGDAVSLAYTSFEGKLVCMRFWFSDTGEIKHSLCGPKACAPGA